MMVRFKIAKRARRTLAVEVAEFRFILTSPPSGLCVLSWWTCCSVHNAWTQMQTGHIHQTCGRPRKFYEQSMPVRSI